MTFKLSRYHIVSDVIADGHTGEPTRLVFATRSGKSLRLKEDVYQKLLQGQAPALPTSTLLMLFDLELLAPQEEDEFQTILTRNRGATDESDTLIVTIQPTADCQLGCSYCGQKHSKVNASADVSMKITDRVISNLKRTGRRHLSIQWFGAEPLMAYSEILRMSDRLIAHCREHGIAYDAHMITNGMSFKPAVFLNLLERQVTGFQITLDGTAETHDIMRITKEGSRTFDIILKNIVSVTALPEFMANDCNVAVRVNVNRTSAPKVPQLIDLLASHRLQERNVSIEFLPVVNWGDNGASSNSFTPQDFAAQEIDWIIYAMRAGFKTGRILPRRSTQPCMVVDKEGEVYDAFGNVYPCYEFPYTPAFEGEEYRIGHLDTIAEHRNDKPVTRNWYTDIEGNVSPCKNCPLFPVCGGGCPKQWLQGEVACPSFKANITDRLVLDFLAKKTDFVNPNAARTDAVAV